MSEYGTATSNPAIVREEKLRRSCEDEEANAFAMALLMPEEWVRKEVARMGGIDIEDMKKLKKLADKFKVSVSVMTLRLGQLSQK